MLSRFKALVIFQCFHMVFYHNDIHLQIRIGTLTEHQGLNQCLVTHYGKIRSLGNSLASFTIKNYSMHHYFMYPRYVCFIEFLIYLEIFFFSQINVFNLDSHLLTTLQVCLLENTVSVHYFRREYLFVIKRGYIFWVFLCNQYLFFSKPCTNPARDCHFRGRLSSWHELYCRGKDLS